MLYINSLAHIFDNNTACVLFADDVKLYTLIKCHYQWRNYNFWAPRQTFATGLVLVLIHNSGHFGSPLPFWASGPPALPGLPMASYATGHYDFVNLQCSLDRLLDWSDEHQLPISIRKCSCIVLGNIDTSNVHCSINDQPINTVREVRDLGVIVDSSLKFNSHISYIVVKANSRASLIHKCFVSRNPEILLRAFKVYVRPLLEYATCVWSPHYNYGVDKIEAVQRKFTERLNGCKDLEYPAPAKSREEAPNCRPHFNL